MWSVRASGGCSPAPASTWHCILSRSCCCRVLFQWFIVQPSELALETPYLKHYIASTRAAYGLDAIKEVAYPAMTDLTAAVVARNQDTVQNIRLGHAPAAADL